MAIHNMKMDETELREYYRQPYGKEWCEEAHSITQRSWRILTPTIRAEGSEIWATYNPELDTDEMTLIKFMQNSCNGDT